MTNPSTACATASQGNYLSCCAAIHSSQQKHHHRAAQHSTNHVLQSHHGLSCLEAVTLPGPQGTTVTGDDSHSPCAVLWGRQQLWIAPIPSTAGLSHSPGVIPVQILSLQGARTVPGRLLTGPLGTAGRPPLPALSLRGGRTLTVMGEEARRALQVGLVVAVPG
jgi:hypothetical protein